MVAGTPCQSFSYAGYRKGLNDGRGNLTLKFVEIVDIIDKIRLSYNLKRCTIFWENVEGVLTDKTNAFGQFISALVGSSDVLNIKNRKWPSAGILRGQKRNVAWRVLDAKYFGVPQQRKRLYLIATDKDFHPEYVLFEICNSMYKLKEFPTFPLVFEKDENRFETFREYTDCLISSYGTKWNGNAHALNGSLFVVQNGKLRRFSPLECERLMGFPDNYTNICKISDTKRYQVIGNSWPVPVIKWIGERLFNIFNEFEYTLGRNFDITELSDRIILYSHGNTFINLGKNEIVPINDKYSLNCSYQPNKCKFIDLSKIVSINVPDKFYISNKGALGILNRQRKFNFNLNLRLKEILEKIV